MNFKIKIMVKYYVINSNTFNEALEVFTKLVNRVDVLCERHKEKKSIEWLDSQDVCLILNVKPRTLENPTQIAPSIPN